MHDIAFHRKFTEDSTTLLYCQQQGLYRYPFTIDPCGGIGYHAHSLLFDPRTSHFPPPSTKRHRNSTIATSIAALSHAPTNLTHLADLTFHQQYPSANRILSPSRWSHSELSCAILHSNSLHIHYALTHTLKAPLYEPPTNFFPCPFAFLVHDLSLLPLGLDAFWHSI